MESAVNQIVKCKRTTNQTQRIIKSIQTRQKMEFDIPSISDRDSQNPKIFNYICSLNKNLIQYLNIINNLSYE